MADKETISKIKMAMINKEAKEDDIFEKDKFDDSLDIKREIIRVHTLRIVKEITSDAIMAKFKNEKDKLYIIDLVYSGKFVIEAMSDELEAWENYDKENNVVNVTKDIKKQIVNLINSTFGLFVDRIAMLCVLNRNVEGNNLLQLILQGKEEEEQRLVEEETEKPVVKKVIAGAKDKLRNQEEEKLRKEA